MPVIARDAFAAGHLVYAWPFPIGPECEVSCRDDEQVVMCPAWTIGDRLGPGRHMWRTPDPSRPVHAYFVSHGSVDVEFELITRFQLPATAQPIQIRCGGSVLIRCGDPAVLIAQFIGLPFDSIDDGIRRSVARSMERMVARLLIRRVVLASTIDAITDPTMLQPIIEEIVSYNPTAGAVFGIELSQLSRLQIEASDGRVTQVSSSHVPPPRYDQQMGHGHGGWEAPPVPEMVPHHDTQRGSGVRAAVTPTGNVPTQEMNLSNAGLAPPPPPVPMGQMHMSGGTDGVVSGMTGGTPGPGGMISSGGASGMAVSGSVSASSGVVSGSTSSGNSAPLSGVISGETSSGVASGSISPKPPAGAVPAPGNGTGPRRSITADTLPPPLPSIPPRPVGSSSPSNPLPSPSSLAAGSTPPGGASAEGSSPRAARLASEPDARSSIMAIGARIGDRQVTSGEILSKVEPGKRVLVPGPHGLMQSATVRQLLSGYYELEVGASGETIWVPMAHVVPE